MIDLYYYKLAFNLTNLLVAPFWLLMILLPKWRVTQRVMKSVLIVVPFALAYAILVLPRLPSDLKAFLPPTIDSIHGLFVQLQGTANGWIHIVAFDLFVGRWVYLDSRERNLSPLLMAPILFSSLMFGPVGFLVYLAARSLASPGLRHELALKLEHMLALPGPTRAIFGLLRKFKPVLVAPGIAVVSKYDDVLEVLGQDEFFSVTEIYLQKMKMTTGPFVLGMPNTPQYQREMGLMRQATRPEDLETIRRFATESASDLVNAAALKGRIDLVGGLTRLVPMRLVGYYFGAPGPDEATAMKWMRAIFREIFMNLGNDPVSASDGGADGQQLQAYLAKLIAARRNAFNLGQPIPDDFLCRLVKMLPAVDDETINRIVGGTIVGTVDTNSKAIAQAIDQLLDRPNELRAAQNAAMEGNDELFARYIFEALRFNPQNPFLIRRCEQPYTVAQGTNRAKLIPQGRLAIIGTLSAMFDEDRFPDPKTFRTDRPPEDYIHFGHGLHTCFGRLIGGILIPTIAKQLLLRPGLRRASGLDGQLQYDGAFPNRMIVEFDRR